MTWNDAVVITILLFLGLLFLGCTILARHDRLTEEERERIRSYYRGGKLR